MSGRGGRGCSRSPAGGRSMRAAAARGTRWPRWRRRPGRGSRGRGMPPRGRWRTWPPRRRARRAPGGRPPPGEGTCRGGWAGGGSGAGARASDALLSGDPRPGGAAAGLRRAAEVIAALRDAPAAGELAAWPGALAVFRSQIAGPGQPARSRRGRHAWPRSRVSARLAAAAAAAAVTLGGAAAAAYAGVLPASVQQLAHDALGAPPARPPAHPAHPATPARATAAGHARYGLCTAYAHLKAHGSARQKAVAFRNLATAAGGAANVTAYCAAVAHPRQTPPPQPPRHPPPPP